MKKYKILVIDDSIVIRQLLKNAIEAYDSLTVVGTAANGLIGLEKIQLYSPDLVVLDIEMPVMDGIETLKNIVQKFPKLKVVMCSTLSAEGAQITLDCLNIGASDFVTKPDNLHSSGSQQPFNELLYEKIIALVQQEPVVNFQPLITTSLPKKQHNAAIKAVGIGISTGGPDALLKLIPALPKNLTVPVFIVQHMPAMFIKLLVERIQVKSEIRVCEGTHTQRVSPGTVYIAPGDHHMTVNYMQGHHFIRLNEAPAVNYSRPSVDVLFESLASAYQEHLLAIVMTGMGKDGLVGCQKIEEYGGLIYTQDQNTSTVWGMPGAVSNAGLSQKSLALAEIGGAVLDAIVAKRTVVFDK